MFDVEAVRKLNSDGSSTVGRHRIDVVARRAIRHRLLPRRRRRECRNRIRHARVGRGRWSERWIAQSARRRTSSRGRIRGDLGQGGAHAAGSTGMYVDIRVLGQGRTWGRSEERLRAVAARAEREPARELKEFLLRARGGGGGKRNAFRSREKSCHMGCFTQLTKRVLL